ncbi:MAG: hypothetical protein IID03_11785 [Candidatus Dadabacteria bacterium]|nr:hypothetical protein [Candidatus Dadabacteria bacterium]
MNLIPKFNIEKIKHGTDKATFDRAIKLYESEKVTKFNELHASFCAVVVGTKPYDVSIEARDYKMGECTCYLGQKNTLCKHIVALAIYVIKQGKSLSEEDKYIIDQPSCSGEKGELDKNQLSSVKKSITTAMRLIKSYNGPSRIWFAYQDDLDEGCRNISSIISELPVSYQTAQLIVDLLLRLDKRLATGGVDDSDGTVGGFIEESVIMLFEYAKIDPSCIKAFKILVKSDTCFGWEYPLVDLLERTIQVD